MLIQILGSNPIYLNPKVDSFCQTRRQLFVLGGGREGYSQRNIPNDQKRLFVHELSSIPFIFSFRRGGYSQRKTGHSITLLYLIVKHYSITQTGSGRWYCPPVPSPHLYLRTWVLPYLLFLNFFKICVLMIQYLGFLQNGKSKFDDSFDVLCRRRLQRYFVYI